tara:strand:- start:1089 stop:1502 length:414 start_codon:yes stop_codon:yes gene_type:complete
MAVYSSRVVTSETLTTAFAAAQVHVHSMNASHPTRITGQTFSGVLSSLTADVDSIADSATTLTLRITHDAAGDVSVVPDVTATIATGVGTATDGSVAFSFPDFVWIDPDGKDLLYVWFKTDAGTATLKATSFGWREG